ncbi:MAG: hypothetical protein U0802_15290 [Candidatus Binatia bacterium]
MNALSSVAIGFNYEGNRWTSAIAIASADDPVVTMLFSPNWGRTSSWSFSRPRQPHLRQQ